jgi:NADH dehydrogenase FAD-containing subunit
LAANLAAVTAGRLASAYMPPANALKLLAYGDGRAIAGWGGHVVQGHLAWWYKDWLDRWFVRRHNRISPPKR